jgi:thioredoxin reductase
MMLNCTVAIIGSGPAGLSAAIALHEQGIDDVLVLERESETGGVPRHCHHPTYGIREFGRLLSGPDYAARLRQKAAAVKILLNTTVIDLLPGPVLTIVTPDGPQTIRAQRVLIATGARETPRAARLISGTRPAGVINTGALQQLIYLAKRKPFRRAVIIGSELVSFSAIMTLRKAGIEAIAMIERNRRITARRPADLWVQRIWGVPVYTDTKLLAIEGNEQVSGVLIERHGTTERLACDGVVISGEFIPETSLLATGHLLRDAGSGGALIDQYWRCSDADFFAAGNVLHPIETAGVAYREGRAAATAIADTLQGRLSRPEQHITIDYQQPVRYVYPQRLASPGTAPDKKLLAKLRVSREVRGRLQLLSDDTEIWSRSIHALPERRIELPAQLLQPGRSNMYQVRLVTPD